MSGMGHPLLALVNSSLLLHTLQKLWTTNVFEKNVMYSDPSTEIFIFLIVIGFSSFPDAPVADVFIDSNIFHLFTCYPL